MAMTSVEFDALKENYVQHCVDGMDMSDMMELVYSIIEDRLDEAPTSDVMEEIKEYAPHLINE